MKGTARRRSRKVAGAPMPLSPGPAPLLRAKAALTCRCVDYRGWIREIITKSHVPRRRLRIFSPYGSSSWNSERGGKLNSAIPSGIVSINFSALKRDDPARDFQIPFQVTFFASFTFAES